MVPVEFEVYGMALFSWFKSTNKDNSVNQKDLQMIEKMDSFRAITMWPIAKVKNKTLCSSLHQQTKSNVHEQSVITDVAKISNDLTSSCKDKTDKAKTT